MTMVVDPQLIEQRRDHPCVVGSKQFQPASSRRSSRPSKGFTAEDTEEKRRHEDAKDTKTKRHEDCGLSASRTVAYLCELGVCALRVLRSAVYFVVSQILN
jgi:hypothetical protein